MCVIVSKPATAELDKARAERLWKRNPDGGGFAFIDERRGRVQVVKSMDFDDYWHRYRSMLGRNPNAHFILHMRIATHGSVNKENVHPFWVDEHTVMMHNGILDTVSWHLATEAETRQMKGAYYLNWDDPYDRSDTRIFVEEYLHELPETWLDNPYLVQMVEEFAKGSKLTFLTTNPALKENVYILNEADGNSKDGMWFSNMNGVNEYKAQATKYNPTKRKLEPISRTSYYSMDDFSDYGWDHKDIIQASDVASLRFENEIKQARAKHGLDVDIQYLPQNDEWLCYDCLETVEDQRDTEVEAYLFGTCACWDKYCKTCEELPTDCDCTFPDRKLVWFVEPKEVIETEVL